MTFDRETGLTSYTEKEKLWSAMAFIGEQYQRAIRLGYKVAEDKKKEFNELYKQWEKL